MLRDGKFLLAYAELLEKGSQMNGVSCGESCKLWIYRRNKTKIFGLSRLNGGSGLNLCMIESSYIGCS
jgi:hypothetical protein